MKQMSLFCHALRLEPGSSQSNEVCCRLLRGSTAVRHVTVGWSKVGRASWPTSFVEIIFEIFVEPSTDEANVFGRPRPLPRARKQPLQQSLLSPEYGRFVGSKFGRAIRPSLFFEIIFENCVEPLMDEANVFGRSRPPPRAQKLPKQQSVLSPEYSRFVRSKAGRASWPTSFVEIIFRNFLWSHRRTKQTCLYGHAHCLEPGSCRCNKVCCRQSTVALLGASLAVLYGRRRSPKLFSKILWSHPWTKQTCLDGHALLCPTPRAQKQPLQQSVLFARI